MEFTHLKSDGRLLLAAKIITIIAALAIVYRQDLAEIAGQALQGELMSYVLAVPILLAYLLFRRMKLLRASLSFRSENHTPKADFMHTIVGALLWLTSILLYWYGFYTFYPLEYHMISLPFFISGLVLLMFNPKTLRVLVFPIIFLAFLIPIPLEISYFAGSRLAMASTSISYNMLKFIGLPVSLSYAYVSPVIVLQKPDALPMNFSVDVACSGMYSLFGFVLFAAFAANIARGKLWKKGLVFITGLPLMYSLNILRIIMVVIIGNQFNMQTALQAFHLMGGWALIFIGTVLLLTFSEKIVKIQLFTNKPKSSLCAYCNSNRATFSDFCQSCGRMMSTVRIKTSKLDLLKILAVVAGTAIVVNLQAPVFALTSGPVHADIQTLSGKQSILILPEIPGYTTNFIFRDRSFEEIAGIDAALTYAYIPSNVSGTTIWVTLEIAQTSDVLHRWESCITVYGARGSNVTSLDLRDYQLLENPPVVARYFAFKDVKSNITQVVLYWYDKVLFETENALAQKQVRISLIAFAPTEGDVLETEEKLPPFGRAIIGFWQPLKTWYDFTLAISRNGIIYALIPIVSIAIILAHKVIEGLKEKKSNLRIYNNLPSDEKKLLRAVFEASRKGRSTGNAIALRYQELTGKTIEPETLFNELQAATEAGLVRRDIENQDDEPVQTWKTAIRFRLSKEK